MLFALPPVSNFKQQHKCGSIHKLRISQQGQKSRFDLLFDINILMWERHVKQKISPLTCLKGNFGKFWCMCVLQTQGMEEEEKGRFSSGGLWEKHTSDSNQFQSRGGRNFCTNEPRVSRLEKNKYKEVERQEITSLRVKSEKKKNSSGFQLANKKAKQSIMSESPHSWLLLPGSGRMK